MLNLIFVVLLSYLVGSIPNSILISKLVKGIDIRNFGSGNAGGSNVFRVLGWKWGILTILLDALKGALGGNYCCPIVSWKFSIFQRYSLLTILTLVQIICGVTAVVGHVFTLFAGFKGGKGIATGLGVLIMIVTVDMAVALGIFFPGCWILEIHFARIPCCRYFGSFDYDYKGKRSSMLISPGYHTILPFAILLAIFVVYTHRSNIGRILQGSERKVSFSKKISG